MLLLEQAIAYFPASVPPDTRVAPPVLVLLHGADRQPPNMIKKFAAEADARGIVLLAPSSINNTWDVVRQAQRVPSRHGSRLDGPAVYRGSRDDARVEAAIAELGKHVPVDRSKMVLAGFSDGATYALALGMSRDHDFATVIAFSPGLPVPAAQPASGRTVLVSHGLKDPVLPFDMTCGAILPELRTQGARLTFRSFDGVHQIPQDVITEFFDAAFGPAPGTKPRPITADKSATCKRRNSLPAEIPMP